MSFTYNDEGIRTSKTVNNVTHTYYLNGNLIVAEQWGNKLIVYICSQDIMIINKVIVSHSSRSVMLRELFFLFCSLKNKYFNLFHTYTLIL